MADIFYHGSSRLFDKFDHSHALESNGKCKFGFGVYVTSSFKTAVGYSRYEGGEKAADHHYIYTLEVPEKTEDNFVFSYPEIKVHPEIIRKAEEKLGEKIPLPRPVEGKHFRKYIGCKLTGWAGTAKQMTEMKVPGMTAEDKFKAEVAAADFMYSIGVIMFDWPHGKNDEHRAYINTDDVKIRRIESVEIRMKGKDFEIVEGSQKLIKEF